MDSVTTEALRQLEQRRSTLLRLTGEAVTTERSHADDAADRSDQIDADEVSQVADRLSGLELNELREIDAALARIRAGSFGQCESCGKAIGRQRLRALPETRLCVTCASAVSTTKVRYG